MNADSRHIAILIDGDNAQASLVEHVLAETAKYGIVTTRRIYGDWTTSEMAPWKESLHIHAVQPMQQFRYTVGKNATDSALIIDAMDLLHGGTVDGFCIVSSDSDYTRLATRIREQGQFVMGVGRAHTPKAFVNACEIFVYAENLSPDPGDRTSDPPWHPQTGRLLLHGPWRWRLRMTVGHSWEPSAAIFDNWIRRSIPAATDTSSCQSSSSPVPNCLRRENPRWRVGLRS